MGQFHDPFSHEGIFRLSEGVSALSRLPSHRLLNIRLAFPWCNMYVAHPHAKTPAHAKILNLLSYLPFAQGRRDLAPLCFFFLLSFFLLLSSYSLIFYPSDIITHDVDAFQALMDKRPCETPCATPAQPLRNPSCT